MTKTINQAPINIATGKAYRGDENIKALQTAAQTLDYSSTEWGTMKQWNAKRETIARNQRGVKIHFKDKHGAPIHAFVFNRCQLVSDTYAA